MAFIAPPDLSNLIANNPSSILILDLRELRDYQQSHIWSSIHVRTQPSLNSRALPYSLITYPPHYQQALSHRDLYDLIIVDDDESSEGKQLLQFLLAERSSKSVKYLIGGFSMMVKLYPEMIEKSDEDPSRNILFLQWMRKLLGNHQYFQMEKEFVFLGDHSSLDVPRILDEYAFSHILNVWPLPEDFPKRHYEIFDCSSFEEFPAKQDLNRLFEVMNLFIHKALSNKTNRVLITGPFKFSCVVICAYLMKNFGWCIEKSFHYLSSLVGDFQINTVLLQRLTVYEKFLDIKPDLNIKEVSDELKYVRNKEKAKQDRINEELKEQELINSNSQFEEDNIC
eukprot:TRINITY_DN1229_c0_g1_i1.p1 TRINITY_DN1229_c0_g1~~TRINITY_DN1229_c0_g1_i1.p1  ORF type:complete len:339 (+),score=69.75 TRINITY_DN1229_c0_g1_i1:192-1208(+)